ncbi:MAG: LysR family transcriptional regulator [Novosphingobium sp.]|nr:LysR family transcriptional regulator [Novosphingobium sp.]
MRVFCTVAELRSFTGAADRLNIAHSAVSKHVAVLERHLSARLLDRTSRRVNLTEVGETYLAEAQRILDSLDEMEAGVRKTAVRPSGLLRISVPPWLVNADMARLMADYRRAFPEVTLDLVLDRVELGATHDYRDLDIALRVTNFPEENMIAHHLATLTFRLVATPAYLDLHGRPATPDEVNGWPLLHYSAYSPDASVVFRSGHHVGFRPIMRSASTEMIYHAMCAGMGPAFMPSSLIERDVAEGRLEYVLPVETASPIKLYAFHPRRPYASAKIASFLGFIEAAFG